MPTPGDSEVFRSQLLSTTLDPGNEPTGPVHYTEPEERYQILELLGVGGMGEVWRVEDRRFDRTLAMKTLRTALAGNIQAIARFREEALSTARLQHPGIVPVHDLGRLPDGRYYFTMKEIRGQTFESVIGDLHRAADGRWQPTPSGWTFTRLMDSFRRACEAVAHAHGKRVLHRDIKPANLMIGDHGEVLVLDWGIARPLEDGLLFGSLAGTPAYMAPELLEQTPLLLSQDVYALGAVLYEILSGHPPYEGTAEEILAALRQGPPPPPAGPSPRPAELLSLCMEAMSRNPQDRPKDAQGLVQALVAWQEGDRRRAQARGLVQQADAQREEVEGLREEARRRSAEAALAREKVRPFEPVERKVEVWRREDEAEAASLAAEEAERSVLRLLHAALAQAPDLEEAHRSLATLYRIRHAEAEAARDSALMRRYESLLRDHDTGEHATYLRGEGSFNLVSEFPATAEIYRFVEKGRRLVTEPVGLRLTTPVMNYHLPMGSYLVELQAPGRLPTRYPLYLPRAGRSEGIALGEDTPRPIRMLSQLGDREAFVPAGWAIFGGDPRAVTGVPRRTTWVDDFVISRFPITNLEYLQYLNALVDEGQTEEALHRAPRERAREGEGALLYGRDNDGHFLLVADADGDAWQPDWPVCLVDAEAAAAYAVWRGKKDGLPWRLPTEDEWEKAARGVDGRFYPWGDRFDASWACLRESHAGRPIPMSVYDFPVDESVYGMRGAAGNMCDWCLGSMGVMIRGGAWSHASQLARIAERRSVAPGLRSETVSFRIARSL